MSSLRRARVSADSPSARGSKPRPGLLARLTRLAARTRLTWWLWVSIVLAVAILVSMLVGMVEHAVDGIRFFARDGVAVRMLRAAIAEAREVSVRSNDNVAAYLPFTSLPESFRGKRVRLVVID
jgi:hypothetical protein